MSYPATGMLYRVPRVAGGFAGTALRTWRDRAGLTQRALAELVGTSEAMIGRWETGTHRPTPASLHRLTRALGVDVDDLSDQATTSLASMRLRQGWTQTELADLIAVSDMTISRLERGISALSAEMALKLADALLVPVRDVQAAYERGARAQA